MLPNPEIKEVTLHDYLRILQKRQFVILAFFVVIVSAAVIYAYTSPVIYRATASILIERYAPKVTKFEGVNPADNYFRDVTYFQTQYKLLGSRMLAGRVFEDLHLDKDKDYKDLKDPIGKLHKQVKVELVKNSQVVLINIEDTDALRAAAIANAFARVYIRWDIENRGRTIKEAAGWLESQLSGIKAKLREAEEALNRYIQENRIVTSPDIEKKTETLLEGLKKNKSDLEVQIAELSKRYKMKHPRMTSLAAQLEDVDKKIDQETNTLLSLNQKMVQYGLLKKEVESSQQLYTSILMRAKETGVSEKIESSSINIIDAARPSNKPFKPNKPKIILISIFASLLLGLLFSLFLEYLDSSVHTAEDVSLYLNLPFLGYVPTTAQEAKSGQEKDLICNQKPRSTIAESYRAIRTSVLFAFPEDKPLKTVLITSTLPQEGKTFVSLNFSTIFSQMNERVVLVDVDMRRPRVHKALKIEQKSGLSDYLTGGATLEEVIKPTCIQNLSLVTSGTIPPNPSELLSSNKSRLFIQELAKRFDRIILDSPPVLSAPDSLLLASVVDGVILVIKGGSTRLELISQTKKRILESRGTIIGVIVNNIQPEKEDRQYYYHYYNEETPKKA